MMAEKNGPRLEFASSAEADLAALYARLGADTPTRKVAYKAMKPNAFFVVSGQDGARKFYSRFEKNEAASPPVRGFTFTYPASAQNLDRVGIAVANSFEAVSARAAERRRRPRSDRKSLPPRRPFRPRLPPPSRPRSSSRRARR